MTQRRVAILGLLLCGALGAACGREVGPPFDSRLRELVEEGRYALAPAPDAALELEAEPRLETVEIGGEARPAVVLPPGRWRWRTRVPASARLIGGVQLLPGSGGALAASVTVVQRLERQVVAEVTAGPGFGDWLVLDANLERFAGRQVELEVIATVVGDEAAEVAWAPLHLEPVAAPSAERPNVVVILIDTLRADRLRFYGGDRPTSPRIESLLVDRGVVVERAYAQAPWTLPSVISLFTGRWPGEVVGAEMGAFELPRTPSVLAATFRRMGYDTGGFSANATLHRGNGFATGFDTFYSPESLKTGMLELHGDELARRAGRWLEAHRRGPFFLYAHFLDPHDPYENPAMVAGRSRYFPDYEGPVTGRHVHGIYLGKHQLQDEERDLAHLAALYDSEVRYVDEQVGRLLESIPESITANTVFVLTSDHGEELFEHGGWKHGRTLYEEQLRVPLVFRWDGQWPPASRLDGTVSLLDLAPTLVAAAGGVAPTQWQGTSLLDRLSDPAADHSRGLVEALFAQHFSDGPPRAMALAHDWKLILFDRRARHRPNNEHQAILYELEMARLERIELYDLGTDPGERVNLAAERPEMVRRLSSIIHQRLGERLPGLRVMLSGLSSGEVVTGSIRFERPPVGWDSYFLGPEDEVVLEGDRLRFELHGEALAKGIRMEGEGVAIGSVEVDGNWPPVTLPDGGNHGGGPLSAERLRSSAFPGHGDRPTLLLWEPETVVVEEGTVDEETMKRLRALGYTG